MQYKTIKPVGDRLLVSIDLEETKSIGGVLLAGSSRNKPNTGKVLAVGDTKFVKVRCCGAVSEHAVHLAWHTVEAAAAADCMHICAV